jgi:TM2 domain-containing membrane protein YozV
MTDGGDLVPTDLAGGPYCTNCGSHVEPGVFACLSCGFKPDAHAAYCRSCGVALRAGQVVCVRCGAGVPTTVGATAAGLGSSGKNRIAAALLAFFLGGLGVHKFYLGRNGAGVAMLAITIGGTCLGMFLIVPFLGPLVIGVIAFVEFIIYLTKSDAEFEEIYVRQGKDWF